MSLMTFYIDGLCRGSDWMNVVGVAAAISVINDGEVKTYIERIWPHSTPTPRQDDLRAQITALILAYRTALIRRDELPGAPSIVVEIRCDTNVLRAISHTDRQKVEDWRSKGWRDHGSDVLNRDLIEAAHDLRERIEQVGRVQFVEVKREVDNYAYRLCESEMDKMQEERRIDPRSGVYGEGLIAEANGEFGMFTC